MPSSSSRSASPNWTSWRGPPLTEGIPGVELERTQKIMLGA